MTEEEIRPIAEDYVEEYCHCPDGEYTDGSLVCAGIGTALIVSRQLEKRIAELKAQIEKMKQELDTAREDANRQEQWELYSVLNGIYNDNFEVTTSVSN